MKKIITLSISLVCFSLFSFAQNDAFEHDADKDGKLSKEEFNKTPSQQVKSIDLRMDKTFDRIDKNNDGFIDKAELREARENRGRKARGNQQERIKSNGKKGMRQKVGKRMVQENREALRKRFDALDRNGNKVLNFREFKKGAKMRPNYTRARAKGMFNRMDSNNDGLLGPKEFTQSKMKQKVKKKGQKRMRGRR